MAKCPNCNKEITFFLGFFPQLSDWWMPIRCPHCYTMPLRPADKSYFIFILGLMLFIFIGGFPTFLFDTILDIYRSSGLLQSTSISWFFLNVLVIWPYIWWKKFTKLEKRIISIEMFGQSNKRRTAPALVILVFLSTIYVLLQGVPHIIFLPLLVILIILVVIYILSTPH